MKMSLVGAIPQGFLYAPKEVKDVYKRQLLLRADGYETDFYKKD